jgi:hypothetical protein
MAHCYAGVFVYMILAFITGIRFGDQQVQKLRVWNAESESGDFS